ncbi:hypothetical protein CLIB1444_11S02454 [[Candida] jaroonii]|uniref:Uncharacterized protein n=1 Tax=[Candida] jaroonii TaxID=467808 RepID=A0ACA9YE47_9ASCO|nr:hypothetical protein CLIB1444_11S02454 [[Candida] jaroonii]
MDDTTSTPRVLKQCVDLILSPKHEKYSIPMDINIHEKFSEHPDIQYFKKIKSKNHFNYHKYKKNPIKINKTDSLMVSDFDPYSRDALISRISSYSTINWKIPFENHELNELRCSQNGWKCVSISINNNSKNHLVCVSCKQMLTLRFNEEDFTTFEFDLKDIEEVNDHLCHEYLKQIQVSAHEENCPWRNFETPVEGIYYLKPFLHSTNEILINNYLHSLKTLVDNVSVIIERQDNFHDLIQETKSRAQIDQFTKNSNTWLMNKFYKHDKENQIIRLSTIPSWIYIISLLSWELKVQSFAHQLVLFLVCPQCNKKVFIDSTQHSPVSPSFKVPQSTGLNLSTSKILTPVKYPPTIMEDEEEFYNTVDLYSEHKPWCFMKHRASVEIMSNYLYDIIVNSETSIGINGELLEDVEMKIGDSQKRRKSFDINEGLERLNKLRKLYLVEE